ncbi:unnamed protein product [Linum trigynum]|uniref:C3H1-type domain-containing protein n=1 Tax=Linum trigynum TaxID=586398 RepID=A0AAV2G505_9ROSI
MQSNTTTAVHPAGFILLTRDKMPGPRPADDSQPRRQAHINNNHHRSSSSIEEQIFGSDEFRMYGFKIKRCNRTRSHDWTDCPYAHKGEKATRRDPRKVPYSAVACPWFRNGACPNGDLCDFAHGVFEYWLHPARYRTRPCNSGPFCQRKVCFFAHSPDQVRPDNHNHHNKYSSSSAAAFHHRRKLGRPGDPAAAAPLLLLLDNSTTAAANNNGVVTRQGSGSAAELENGGCCYFRTAAVASPTGSEELFWTPMRLDGGSYFDGVSEFLNSLRKLSISGEEEEEQDTDDDSDRVFSAHRRQTEPPTDELPQIDWVSDLVN